MSRVLSVSQHDDGRNSWRMVSVCPPPDMAGVIRAYCDYSERSGTFNTRRELPHAEGVLMFNLGEATSVVGGNGQEVRLNAGDGFIAGPHLRPALSRSNGSQSGIQIDLPLHSLRRLFKISMPPLLDTVVPLEDVLGREARELGQRLGEAATLEARVECLDAAFRSQIARTPPIEPRQLGALALLSVNPRMDIANVARKVGWSRKHLADRIHDAVGVGPRSFRRLLRFQCVTQRITALADPDWTAVALDSGYCDQSHLIREFREFANMTPTQFMARSLPNGGGLVES